MKKRSKKRIPAGVPKESTLGISTFVVGCFLFSGLTGLIYEVLWVRMIVKVIGCAPFAVSIVLTVFMGGLGLGSYLASKTIDRIREPRRLLRIYALLELAIGAYAIVLPGLIIAFRPIYRLLYNELFEYFFFYNLLTLLGCSILLLIPVTCMGATLPVLCRFYIARLGHLGTRAGRLYAVNTIGAAFGSVLAGFLLINLLGVWGTLLFAVLLNGLIGGSCLLASYRVKKWPKTEDAVPPDAVLESSPKQVPTSTATYHSPGDAVGALVIFAVSGFCAMAYEVIWTRLLGLLIGPTTYSFCIVLATFIVGLALGSLVFGWAADKTRRPLSLLIVTQIGAGFLALLISQLLGNSQLLFAKLIHQNKDQFSQLALVKGIILFGLMLGPTLCLGATFPLVGKICTQSLARVGKSLGSAYAVNTVGAVLGSFSAGFLLIPWLGKEHGLSLVIGFQFLVSLMIGVYLLRKKKDYRVRLLSFTGVALLGLVLCSFFPHWNRQLLSRGRYHRFGPLAAELTTIGWLECLWRGPEILSKYETGYELLYYGDGIGGFTTVGKTTDVLGVSQYVLLNSGKPDASTQGDMATQTLSAHLPLLFHPHPKEVMVLGLASGISAGEALHYPLERLDIIEISEQVVSASRFFIPWNNDVLSNPKTDLILQDGRAHLELTNREYDVIISEPSNPWMAGLASLFTREFFLLAKNRLREDGMFVQFFHSYQMNWPTFALIVRTFSGVFPHSLLVSPYEGDYLLVGFKEENRLNLMDADKNIRYTRESKNVRVTDPRLLYRLIVTEDLDRMAGPGPVHTDNRPLLEFAAPKLLFTFDPDTETNIRSKRWLTQETAKILQDLQTVEAQIAFATFALSVHKPFHKMVDLSMATTEEKERFTEIMGDYCSRSLIEDFSIFTDHELKERCIFNQRKALQRNLHRSPDPSAAYSRLGDLYLEEDTLPSAIESYEKALGLDPNNAEAHNKIGVIYRKQGRIDEAVVQFKKALSINPDYAEAHYNLGNAYEKRARLDDAISEYKKAIEINPGYGKAHNNLGMAYHKKGNLEAAIPAYKNAIAIDPDLGEAHNNLFIAYYYTGNFRLAVEHCDKALELGVPVKPKYLELIKPYR